MRLVVVVVVVAAVVGGCAVQGKAVEAHFWDPCTELSDLALREAGAKPETKDDDVQLSGWRMCGWQTTFTPYQLGVYTSEERLSSFAANPKYSGFRSAVVDGRRGVTYLLSTVPAGTCDVAFDTARGSIHIEMARSEVQGDACPLALEVTRKLLPYLPTL